MRTIVAAALAGLVLAGQCFAAIPTPEERYPEALAILDGHCDQFCGYGIHDSAEERAALDRLWDATQDWMLAYLNTHPAAVIADINKELRRRHKQDETNIAPNAVYALAPGLYGVTASWEWTGDVFAVANRDSRWQVVWDARKIHSDAFPALKAWRTERARNDCENNGNASHDVCGPILGSGFEPLPVDGQGNMRFALLAFYGQLTESTVGGQLSVWTWDGTAVRPQWAKPYLYNFDDVSWKQNGDLIKIRATDWWHTLSACGTCIGRQMNWTLRLRPDGVDDLGMKPVAPELDAFDELAWRIFKGENADDLATPKVRARLAAIIKAVQVQDEEFRRKAKDVSFDPNWFSFGMFSYKVQKVAGGRVLDLNADDLEFLGYWLRVRFQRRGERLFAVDLAQVPVANEENPAHTAH